VDLESSIIKIKKSDLNRGRIFSSLTAQSFEASSIMTSLDRVRKQGFGRGTGTFILSKNYPKLIGVRVETNIIDTAVALSQGLPVFIEITRKLLKKGSPGIYAFSQIYRTVQSVYEE